MSAHDTSTRLPAYNARGLDAAEAARRLTVCGPNELVERAHGSPWRIVWEQLTSAAPAGPDRPGAGRRRVGDCRRHSGAWPAAR
jgi:hypothetical protein